MIFDLKYHHIITNCRIIFLLVLILGAGTVGWTQERQALQQQKKVIEKWIQATNKMLLETEKNKTATIDKYNLIQNQINNRKSLLKNINDQISTSQSQLVENEEIITLLQKDIQAIKTDYNDMIKYAYRKKLMQNEWLYILSSESVKEAFLKLRYTRQYNDYKSQKANILQQRMQELEVKSAMLDDLIENQEVLLASEKEASLSLQSELYDKDVVLNMLVLNSTRLTTELAQQEKEKRRLDKVLEEIIRAEIAKESAAQVSSRNDAPQVTSMAKLSKDFTSNKGKLSWPVDQGFISSRFGVQKHPTLQNVSIQNNGIDIRSTSGVNVKSIFDGKVSKKLATPGYGNMVIIKHGNYLVVYARMDEVYVNEGDDVRIDQTIGTLGQINNKSELQLQIWRNNEKLDPETWLARRR